jgi:hypothetical protein
MVLPARPQGEVAGRGARRLAANALGRLGSSSPPRPSIFFITSRSCRLDFWNVTYPPARIVERERSATGLREADLDVLSTLGKQGLEWRLEPEAFTGVKFGVRTMSCMSWSDVRSISRWRGSHRRRRPLAFSMAAFCHEA